MRSLLLLCLVFVGCGAVAGWQVGALLPKAPADDELQTWVDDYRLERPQGDPFLVTDGRWLRVLRLIPDFDLHMDVELGADMDLDLLVRHVEPRLVHGRVEPFTERFVALRLTTGRDGPAFRTREQALFGERGLGASLAPGMPATVWVQGRGRLLRANVAGRWTSWCEAEDTEGMFALVARGGTAVLRRLVIENRGVTNAWLRWRPTWLLLGAGLGLLLAAVAAVRPLRWWAAVGLGAAWIGLVWLQLTSVDLQPLRSPPPNALLLLLAAPVPFVIGAMLGGWIRDGWLCVVVAASPALWLGAQAQARRLLHSDTHEVDAVFGRDAGNSLSEALAQLVRGPFSLHSPADSQRGVFLLGGALLYGRLAPRTEHLEPLLGGELRRMLGAPVPVVGLPTEEGRASVSQQWTMFRRFFTGYRPRVVVFGVPVTEGDRDAGEAAATLQATVRAARDHAAAHEAALVLFTDAGLAAPLLDVLRTAEREGVPLVVAGDGEPAPAVARQLAAAIHEQLR